MAYQTPVLVQQTAAASTTAAPASFTANFGSNTTAGTFLVALVMTANSGAGPTINAPTSWPVTNYTTAVGNASISGRVFVWNNNPGGFTAVAFTGLVGINAIAVALFEFQGMPTVNVQLDPYIPQTGIFSTSATSRSISATPVVGNGLWLGLLGCSSAQSITAANAPTAGIGTWQTGTSATSTTGATNLNISSFYATPGPAFPTGGVMTSGLSTAGAVFMGSLLVDFFSLASSPIQSIGTTPYGSLATGAGVGTAVGL